MKSESRHTTPFDLALLIAVVILLGLGLVMVLSASSVLAYDKYGSPTYFFLKQVTWGLVAFILMWFFSRVPYSVLGTRGVPHLAVLTAIVLLVVVLLWGDLINNSRRWIRFGGIGFQPSELAKLALIIYFADIFSRKDKQLRDWKKGFLPQVMVFGTVAGLIYFEPDLSTVVMLTVIVGTMALLSNVRLKHIMATAVVMAPLVAFKMLRSSNYQSNRLSSWFNNWDNPLGSSYQITQSLVGLGRGGLFGQGPGNSKQKYLFLPESHTDFVFSILGEELGFIGTSLVLILFLVIMWRGIVIARKTRDPFGQFLAVGITMSLVWYAFINAGVVSMLLPTTGLPMPLLSYGGSSLMIMGISLGILFNISKQANENKLQGNNYSPGMDRAGFENNVVITD